MILIGLDPSLASTGWGVIAAQGNRLSHIANGQIKTNPHAPLPERLVELDAALTDILLLHQPASAGVEEVFQNSNPQSTLKLGQARGVILLGLARTGLAIEEYAARFIKKAVVGVGNADKAQVHAMVQRLLPGISIAGADAADALAVAITHAHMLGTAASRRER
jgi:crossover junction endodeoxyribonuclease RuvC